MAEQGRYHGQRFKASEVLQLYALGERDFRGTILRGCNFRDADLSGADFSGADIRSARFVGTTLRRVRFCHAKGGIQSRHLTGQLLLVIAIAALAGFLQGYAGSLIGHYFTKIGSVDLITAITGVIVISACLFAIARQGFTLKALGSVTAVFAVVFAITVSFAVSFAGAGAVAVAGTLAGTVAVAVARTDTIWGLVARVF